MGGRQGNWKVHLEYISYAEKSDLIGRNYSYSLRGKITRGKIIKD
ncbi:hypothetical protein B4102_2228 [Heyndrickxia sporothermodurans]|uniref:Uncharacterized protein n=1 Tax=Heyndrickxia sporothermodurans TaxID=46224 RepID=A0A150LFW5_9BACI|nr:hypothetical protein B4102_2228 [Heyndrickxia sporothermodurans]